MSHHSSNTSPLIKRNFLATKYNEYDEKYVTLNMKCQAVIYKPKVNWLALVLSMMAINCPLLGHYVNMFHNQINDFLVRCMVSMGHIQTCNIHRSLCQLPYHFPSIGCRTNCANNLHLASYCKLRSCTQRCVTTFLNCL